MGVNYQLSEADIEAIASPEDRACIAALAQIYGCDVNEVLNRLHALSVCIAVLSGVSPEDFMGGIKHHWDQVREIVNNAG